MQEIEEERVRLENEIAELEGVIRHRRERGS